jgi:hypothetical protein
MESLTGASNRALLDAYDFGRFESVVDVGGGNGALLAALLGEFPAMRGVVFDQPHVVANAAAVLERAGVADRCEIEWDALVTRAGFRLAAATPSTSGLAVIEAVPATPD